MKINKLIVENMLSISAIFISVLALSLSWLQFSDSRKHNQLTLKPIVQVVHNRTGTPDDGNEGVFHIHNDGVGPALLTAVEIYIGEELIDKPELEAWLEVFERLKIGNLHVCLQVGALTGSSLPPSAEHYILRVKDPDIIPGKRDKACESWIVRQQLNKFLANVRVRVMYESVYEQKFVAESRSAKYSIES